MSANVLTLDAAKQANLDLPEELGEQAVHDVVTAMRANRRSGTAHTKTRGEVADSGKKPFRQKGTGNARQGGNASPIHRGGGIVFGPRNRSYAKNVNRKTKRLAFASALAARIEAGDVVSVDSFEVPDRKTKSFVAQLVAAAGTENALVISDSFSRETHFAGRNLATAQRISAAEVSTEQILYFDKIVVTTGAMPVLAKRTTA